jgi:uncharacterized membrane protein YoaK (UPF0700 family)
MLACMGGALDAFTYLGHGHVFANAMTGNVVLFGVNAVQGDWHQALHHFFPIVSFFLGVSTAEGIKEGVFRNRPESGHALVLSFEIAIFAILGCLPASTSDFLITISVAFGASLQTAAFRTVEGRPYNSTFTTGNLRALSESLFAWLVRKRTSDAQSGARVFAAVCGSFLLGTVIGALLTPILYNKTLWVICAVLVFVRQRLVRQASGPRGGA